VVIITDCYASVVRHTSPSRRGRASRGDAIRSESGMQNNE